MPIWNEQIKNHQVWQLLQNLGPIIDNGFAREGTDSETMDCIARLKSILTFIGRRLAGADPYLMQLGPLNSLSNSLQSINNEVQNFVANGNPGHITNANTQGDSALSYLAQLNVPFTTEDFIAAKEAAEVYRLAIEKALIDVKSKSTEIQNDLNVLKTRISDITAEVTTERSKISSIATDFQSQFSTAQESRSKVFTDTQKDRQDQFTTLFTDFSQKLTDQDTAFTKQREEIARLHQSELEKLVTHFVEATTEIRDSILERKEEVEKLVGVIGNLGVTSGYLNNANEAKFTVRVWQFVTVFAMLGLITIAYYAFLPAINGEFTWSGFAGRVFVSLTVGVLAAYAASQADKYQKIERQNRRLALELEAIGPFIAPLPQDKQEEFRLTIGDRSFGHGDGAQGGFDNKSPTTVVDLLLESKQFRSFITDLVKAAKS